MNRALIPVHTVYRSNKPTMKLASPGGVCVRRKDLDQVISLLTSHLQSCIVRIQELQDMPMKLTLNVFIGW